MCAAAGMAARMNVVETNLIGGNAIRITTRSGKACSYFALVLFSLC
jgi:hypothetical protein